MAVIKISALRVAGSELFQDSESYLNELSDQEMGVIDGSGLSVIITPLLDNPMVKTKVTVSIGIIQKAVSFVSIS